MQNFNKSLALVVLICATSALELSFSSVEVSSGSAHVREHHSTSNLKPHGLKDYTTDDDKITDNQFHVNVSVNDKPYKMVVDTSSFYTYL
jgi:hypothetical protein